MGAPPLLRDHTCLIFAPLVYLLVRPFYTILEHGTLGYHIQDQAFKCFESDMIKLSVNNKLSKLDSGLLDRACAFRL